MKIASRPGLRPWLALAASAALGAVLGATPTSAASAATPSSPAPAAPLPPAALAAPLPSAALAASPTSAALAASPTSAALAASPTSPVLAAPLASAQALPEDATLEGVVAQVDAGFGAAVALDGDTLAVGVPGRDPSGLVDAGAVEVFVREAGGWTRQAVLDGGAADERLGSSVALQGDVLLAGAPGASAGGFAGAGRVQVFTRVAGVWSAASELVAGDPGANEGFGTSVAIDVPWVAVGAPRDGEADQMAGAVYLFRGTTGFAPWAKHFPPGIIAQDWFGFSVALDGGTLVCGALLRDSPAVDAGAAFVYELVGSTWTEAAELRPETALARNYCGSSVSVDGDRIAFGGPGNFTTAGRAEVFERAGGVWSRAAVLAPPPDFGTRFGEAVRVSGERVAVGQSASLAPSTKSGAVQLYRLVGGAWTYATTLAASDGERTDQLGAALAFRGDTIAAGAPGDDTTATGAGTVRVFELPAPDVGATFCFGDGSGTPCPCGNAGAAPGEGCAHSGGHGTTLAASGTASIAADDLVLTAEGLPPGNAGLFFGGLASLAPGVPFWDGLQCVGGDTRRFRPLFQVSGTAQDTAFVAQEPTGTWFTPGVPVYLQHWTRDANGPSPCGTGANLSAALAVTMTP